MKEVEAGLGTGRIWSGRHSLGQCAGSSRARMAPKNAHHWDTGSRKGVTMGQMAI